MNLNSSRYRASSDSSQIHGNANTGQRLDVPSFLSPNQQVDYGVQDLEKGVTEANSAEPPEQHNSEAANGSVGDHQIDGDLPRFQPCRAPHPAWKSGDKPTMWTVLSCKLDLLIRQFYLTLLLRLPHVYFFRTIEIFEASNLELSEIKKMALEAAFYKNGYRYAAPHDMRSDITASYRQLEVAWNVFADGLLRDWRAYNVVSVLLLSAILTMLQIDSAEQDPLIRYSLLFSQICALMSLLFGCLFSIRFDSSMRKLYKAAEWAVEAQKARANVWWNIWVLLAMPAVWLAWSIIFYLVGIMSFVWRTGAQTAPAPTPLTDTQLLVVRILITLVLGLGCVSGGLGLMTFHRYGRRMDRRWARRIQAWIEAKEPPREWSEDEFSDLVSDPEELVQRLRAAARAATGDGPLDSDSQSDESASIREMTRSCPHVVPEIIITEPDEETAEPHD
ncbi:hypothetical protein HYPSUDRAFT_72059 [Hypholoma sublateritium FD-334 SS-4]|uniref:Uncharacterized protein n=1 Tax=Hypholoma sublateritium (strain FD-334 SS-4) TaxID=945553 RepID=A0A0D2NFJ5_HYPSF|nr:hypothetical protein HYPSUDRAFT_72059 [Hypholoma sublateritium FD-334 SS-4]